MEGVWRGRGGGTGRLCEEGWDEHREVLPGVSSLSGDGGGDGGVISKEEAQKTVACEKPKTREKDS